MAISGGRIRYVAAHAAALTRFQVGLLITTIVVVASAAALLAFSPTSESNSASHNRSSVRATHNGKSFLSKNQEQKVQSAKDADAEGNGELISWKRWFAVHGMTLGLSLLGGFAIGFAFRAFLKTMAVLTAVALVSLTLLSYFRVLNLDLTTVREQWTNNSDWITGQATRIKDVVWGYLPSSTAGMAGLFIGMMRK